MKNKTLIVSMAVMLLWGSLFPMVKLGYSVFGISALGDILAFAGMRFLICGGVITLFCLVKNPAACRISKRELLPVLLCGLFSVILHYAFTYTGLQLTGGSKTAILKQLGAVFYICFSAAFFADDKLTWQKMLGLLLGIGGIVAINTGAGGISFHMGDLLIVAASFCTVFANVAGKRATQTVAPIVMTGVSQLFGGIVLLALGIAFGGKVTAVVPKTTAQIGVFGGIVLASTVSYCLWYAVVQKEKLSKLFIIKFSEPLFAAVFSWLLLKENVWRINYLAAFLLISGGIVLANISKKQNKLPE